MKSWTAGCRSYTAFLSCGRECWGNVHHVGCFSGPLVPLPTSSTEACFVFDLCNMVASERWQSPFPDTSSLKSSYFLCIFSLIYMAEWDRGLK